MTDKQITIDGEHDMNYCEDDNCKHYGNKEQCEKTHCYYRSYSKLYTVYKCKEQECERLEEVNNTLTITREKLLGDLCIAEESLKDYTEHYNRQSEEVDQIKAEVKSKTEYIQEQREIIDQYSKEIEMYKKCQGERASKREEGLKAENKKLKQTLTEIKEILEIHKDNKCAVCPNFDECVEHPYCDNKILQKISEAINE